ncbi:efflux RND transporter periplasmic adaptor subunit [Thalassotalea sp. M1531]|uniref:Efflux RND transporter periplasmic adaptor subunit n=1 Tax=Thalassotalea algicola TaxID=2716224 RepID=A0A7Y0LCG8_9GAMM|nr:efflux RND transporter periplasmic adaptor subunit [Thalassotalea algicola]NMP31901.1 efflux RND transporter periplasmic adaptor subunit [Thalassotalea algicola]
MLNRRWLAERPYVLAAVIASVLVLWMMSGMMQAEEVTSETESKHHEVPVPKVKVETLYAQPVFDSVELYGRTEPDRTTTLKAEIPGRVVEVLARRGARVKKGDVIARIAINDLNAQLAKSKALLVQREMEYQGTLKLNQDGYQGKVQLSRAEADLESVKAEISRLEIDIANTVIRAPFNGVMNTRYIEVGDYVKNGDKVAMIADLNPLIVRAHVTENQINQLQRGQKADIKLLNSQQAQGEIRYIASVADDATNTFKIEVAIDNSDFQLLAGLSGEVNIPLTQVDAIKISPALLALDEVGNVGVKTVNENTVVFTGIDIVKTESDGIWLTGLGQQADIITLGQGFVRDGDTVQAVFPDLESK